MELKLVWQVLRRRLWIILIPLLITLVFSLPALPDAISPPETYGASMRFTAAAPPEITNAIAAEQNDQRSGTYEDTAYVPWLASEYVVVNLPSWVTSSSFAREVSLVLAQDGWEIDTDELRRAFASDSARSILTIYFGWDNETELEKIAAATVTVLQTRNQDYFPQFGTAPAQIVPLDEVEVVRTSPPIFDRLRPFIQIALALAAGLLLAFLADYLDDSVRDTDDLEKIGLNVIGSIPHEYNTK